MSSDKLNDIEKLMNMARSEAGKLEDGAELESASEIPTDNLFDEFGNFIQLDQAEPDVIKIDLRCQDDREALSRFTFFHKNPFVSAALVQRIEALNKAGVDEVGRFA